ncbi:MAG: hypothetical protein AB7O97_09975 [Planctomycetota bacterium]
MRSTPSLLAVAALSAVAAAQTPVVLPPSFDLSYGTSSTSLLGGDTTRTQLVFAAPFPIGTPIFGVGFRCAAGTADRASFTADIEIMMSSSTAAPGALSSTFTTNQGSDLTVVFPRQMATIPANPANRSTGQFAQFVFPTPYIVGLNGDANVVIDVFVHGRSAGASWSTDRAFASANGRLTTYGIGCGAGTITSTTATSAYLAGGSFTVDLNNAPPSTFGLLMYSVDQKEVVPGLLLPLDLSILGLATGCDLMVNPSGGATAYAADAVGHISVPFTIPPGIAEVGVGWQWGYFVAPSAANPAGIEVTNVRQTYIGPQVVVPNAQYVWDLFDVNAATGTNTTNSVPITQFLL